jgi:hypothetical protein
MLAVRSPKCICCLFRCGIIFLRHHLNLLSLTPPDLQSIRVAAAAAAGEAGAFDLQQPVHLDAEYLYLAAGCLSEEQTLLAVVSALPHLPVRALLVPVVRKVSSKRVAAHGVEVSLLPIIGGIGALPRALLSSSKGFIPVCHALKKFFFSFLPAIFET